MYPPGPGEALSGQGARSQRSHTAAHCPGLRAASQRQGGWERPFGPCSWDMFLGLLGVAAGSGRPESRFLPAAATMPCRWARRR